MQTKIENLIQKYAEVYSEFESYQKKKLLAGGDQKTGVIGEYYAKLYVASLPNIVDVEYSKPGGFSDLICKTDKGSEFKIQVKCVSAHSKTRTIAPINLTKSLSGENAFDELYLISLDDEFKPIGFYINSFQEIEAKASGKPRIVGSRMTDTSGKPHNYLDFTNNRVNQLREILGFPKL